MCGLTPLYFTSYSFSFTYLLPISGLASSMLINTAYSRPISMLCMRVSVHAQTVLVPSPVVISIYRSSLSYRGTVIFLENSSSWLSLRFDSVPLCISPPGTTWCGFATVSLCSHLMLMLLTSPGSGALRLFLTQEFPLCAYKFSKFLFFFLVSHPINYFLLFQLLFSPLSFVLFETSDRSRIN